ncbi:glycoside hydrolase family 3 C-terminal domain-containing protein [Tanacetum coccineum]
MVGYNYFELFENPLSDLSMAQYLGDQNHRDLARKAVRKSLVLLKNGKSVEESTLPLPKLIYDEAGPGSLAVSHNEDPWS